MAEMVSMVSTYVRRVSMSLCTSFSNATHQYTKRTSWRPSSSSSSEPCASSAPSAGEPPLLELELELEFEPSLVEVAVVVLLLEVLVVLVDGGGAAAFDRAATDTKLGGGCCIGYVNGTVASARDFGEEADAEAGVEAEAEAELETAAAGGDDVAAAAGGDCGRDARLIVAC